MRAVIYLRVSTKEQVQHGSGPEGFSIPAQRRACRRRAEDLGADLVREFVDAGVSARTMRRPGLQALLGYLVTESVDFVIVHKLDRLARNLGDDLALRLAIRQAGAQLVSVAEAIDDTAVGQLNHSMMAVFNEFYSGRLGEEALKGATEKARQGGTPFRAPIGYRNVIYRDRLRENRTVELDPERAPLIRWAFTAYATGTYTISELARELERRGLTPRDYASTRLRPNLVGDMLANRYYLGQVTYRGREHHGSHPPLVSATTFAACQLIRSTRRRAKSVRTHAHYAKSLLSCARCGSALGITVSKRRFAYFYCLARRGGRGCSLPFLPLQKVEQRIQTDLVAGSPIAQRYEAASSRLRRGLLLTLYTSIRVDDHGTGQRHHLGKDHDIRLSVTERSITDQAALAEALEGFSEPVGSDEEHQPA